MQVTILGSPLTPPSPAVTNKSDNRYTDYSTILDNARVEYYSSEYYWQVGRSSKTQGWILHLSVVRPQFIDLLHIVLPMVLERGLPFKIIRDNVLADSLLEGQLGSIYLAKMIGIYPDNDRQAIEIAKELISVTKGFDGPSILTDRCLGGNVYTRYGSLNPVICKGPNGNPVKHIYNKSGKLIPDPYDIPFSMPFGITWPFGEICSHVLPSRPILLNRRYYPMSTIKKDVKGNVISAIFFEKPWKVISCVVKQGCRSVIFDDASRDIRDRLKWQYKLFHELSPDIPLPQIFDYFEEYGDGFLVMKLVDGVPLAEVVQNCYKGGIWTDLTQPAQIRLMGYLLRILQIIQSLHEKGYVHRDITPLNFLIDRRNERVWLIDIELMFSVNEQYPAPAFAVGTPGFMSPEQQRTQTPSYKEDIYAFGALMLFTYTNLPPTKFNTSAPQNLKDAVLFFTRDDKIADCISRCIQRDPAERPNLEFIEFELSRYCFDLLNADDTLAERDKDYLSLSVQQLWAVVQAAIDGLGEKSLLSAEYYWVSPFLPSKETKFGNEQMGNIIYEGWHTGVSGPLWLLSIAKRNGFNIENVRQPYFCSWEYIKENFFAGQNRKFTLFSGGAGIAMALSEAFHSNLLAPDSRGLSMKECFSKHNYALTLAEGVAGQGMALLQVSQWLDPIFVRDLSNAYIGLLLSSQRKDGSWDTASGADSEINVSHSLARGTIGIIWYFLHYVQFFEDSLVNLSLSKALGWLASKRRRKKGVAMDKIGDTTLVLIRAYEVLKNELYREMAVANLQLLTPRIVLTNFSLGNGLAGIGEIYLEAHQAFKNEEWRQRAAWIANVFVNCSRTRVNGDRYWITEYESTPTADLFVGNAGIIHFLMRFIIPENLGHPLSISANGKFRWP